MNLPCPTCGETVATLLKNLGSWEITLPFRCPRCRAGLTPVIQVPNKTTPPGPSKSSAGTRKTMTKAMARITITKRQWWFAVACGFWLGTGVTGLLAVLILGGAR